MRSSVFSILLAACAISASANPIPFPADSSVTTRRSVYERHTERYRNVWHRLIPNQTTMQYAGSIGFLSIGTGWHYGRDNKWETDLLIGFVPRYESDKAKATLTLKERFIPWKAELGRSWQLEPFTTGLFFNTIFGEDFWANPPSRYPKKYYGFPTKIRSHVFIGQRIRYKIPASQRRYSNSLALYYELSTCDLYIASAFGNRAIRLGDILSLSFGLQFEIF